jgi:hypothetical protein
VLRRQSIGSPKRSWISPKRTMALGRSGSNSDMICHIKSGTIQLDRIVCVTSCVSELPCRSHGIALIASKVVVSADVMGGKVLGKPIPRAATRTMQGQMPGANKRGHVIFDRAAIRASCLGNVTDRDTSAFAAKLQDLN